MDEGEGASASVFAQEAEQLPKTPAGLLFRPKVEKHTLNGAGIKKGLGMCWWEPQAGGMLHGMPNASCIALPRAQRFERRDLRGHARGQKPNVPSKLLFLLIWWRTVRESMSTLHYPYITAT